MWYRTGMMKLSFRRVVMLGVVGVVLQAPSKSVWDGVYTEEQAARGGEAVANNCESCHAKSDFAGPDFMNIWSGQTAFALYDNIRALMPQDRPGALSKETYADIVSFMFKSNSFPAGKSELPTDDATLKQIRIEPKGR